MTFWLILTCFAYLSVFPAWAAVQGSLDSSNKNNGENLTPGQSSESKKAEENPSIEQRSLDPDLPRWRVGWESSRFQPLPTKDRYLPSSDNRKPLETESYVSPITEDVKRLLGKALYPMPPPDDGNVFVTKQTFLVSPTGEVYDASGNLQFVLPHLAKQNEAPSWSMSRPSDLLYPPVYPAGRPNLDVNRMPYFQSPYETASNPQQAFPLSASAPENDPSLSLGQSINGPYPSTSRLSGPNQMQSLSANSPYVLPSAKLNDLNPSFPFPVNEDWRPLMNQ